MNYHKVTHSYLHKHTSLTLCFIASYGRNPHIRALRSKTRVFARKKGIKTSELVEIAFFVKLRNF